MELLGRKAKALLTDWNLVSISQPRNNIILRRLLTAAALLSEGGEAEVKWIVMVM